MALSTTQILHIAGVPEDLGLGSSGHCRIHVHLSWYLSNFKVPSYGKNILGDLVFGVRKASVGF